MSRAPPVILVLFKESILAISLRLASNSPYLSLPSSPNYMHMPLQGVGLKIKLAKVAWDWDESAWNQPEHY